MLTCEASPAASPCCLQSVGRLAPAANCSSYLAADAGCGPAVGRLDAVSAANSTTWVLEESAQAPGTFSIYLQVSLEP